MKSIETNLAILMGVLVSFGALFAWALVTDSDNKLLFFIGFVSLMYPVVNTIRSRTEPNLTSVELVKSTSSDALEILINKKIGESKSSIVKVDFVTSTAAFITYKNNK